MEMGLPVKKIKKSFGGASLGGSNDGIRGAAGANYNKGGEADESAQQLLDAVDGLEIQMMQKLWLTKEMKSRAGDSASMKQFLVEKVLPVLTRVPEQTANIKAFAATIKAM